MKIFSALLSIVLLVYGCLMLIPPKHVKNVSFYGDTDGLVNVPNGPKSTNKI